MEETNYKEKYTVLVGDIKEQIETREKAIELAKEIVNNKIIMASTEGLLDNMNKLVNENVEVLDVLYDLMLSQTEGDDNLGNKDMTQKSDVTLDGETLLNDFISPDFERVF